MHDDGVPRSRNLDASACQHLLDIQIEALLEAERKTDPTVGRTADGKDHEAFRTLLCAGELAGTVAAWAIDHVCGLSVAGQKMLSLQPKASKSHADYVAYRRLADAHNHEIQGGQVYDSAPNDPEIRRLILRNLVFAGANAFPPWLRDELLQALDALDSGTCMPLLEPAKRVGTEYSKAHARLRLVTFVKFRSRAYGISEEKSREFVGSKIGRSAEAIKDWEQRLKDSCLGPLKVHRHITFAINAASYVRYAVQQKHTGDVSESDIAMARQHERQWNTEALDQAVAEWKAAEGLDH